VHHMKAHPSTVRAIGFRPGLAAMPSIPKLFWSINVLVQTPPVCSTHLSKVHTGFAASSTCPRCPTHFRPASQEFGRWCPTARATHSDRRSRSQQLFIVRSTLELEHAEHSDEMALWTPTQIAQWLFAFVTGLPFWVGGAALLLAELAKRSATHRRSAARNPTPVSALIPSLDPSISPVCGSGLSRSRTLALVPIDRPEASSS